jgi:hypothetical protein
VFDLDQRRSDVAGWGLDTISEGAIWALVVIGVIATVAVASLLKK